MEADPWQEASGDPRGWRVWRNVRGHPRGITGEEALGPKGRTRYFKTPQAARRAADKLNREGE